MCLSSDFEVGGGECLLDRGDELMVRNGTPALRVTGRDDRADFLKVHMLSAAVKSEIGGSAGGIRGLGIEIGDHGGVFLSLGVESVRNADARFSE